MVKSVHAGDIYEGFGLLNQGDSATFIVAADSVWTKLFRMPKAPPEFDSVEFIYFHVRLLEVITAEDLNKRKEEEARIAGEREITERTDYLQKNYPDVVFLGIERNLERLLDFQRPVEVERIVVLDPMITHAFHAAAHDLGDVLGIVDDDPVTSGRFVPERQPDELVDLLEIGRRFTRPGEHHRKRHLAVFRVQ